MVVSLLVSVDVLLVVNKSNHFHYYGCHPNCVSANLSDVFFKILYCFFIHAHFYECNVVFIYELLHFIERIKPPQLMVKL